MDLAAVRRFALSLPEATEEPHFDLTSFRVRGKIFATVPPDEVHVRCFVDEAEVRAAVAEEPAACTELHWGKKLSGVEVTIAAVTAALIEELLTDSWRRKAPKTLVTAFDAAQLAAD